MTLITLKQAHEQIDTLRNETARCARGIRRAATLFSDPHKREALRGTVRDLLTRSHTRLNRDRLFAEHKRLIVDLFDVAHVTATTEWRGEQATRSFTVTRQGDQWEYSGADITLPTVALSAISAVEYGLWCLPGNVIGFVITAERHTTLKVDAPSADEDPMHVHVIERNGRFFARDAFGDEALDVDTHDQAVQLALFSAGAEEYVTTGVSYDITRYSVL